MKKVILLFVAVMISSVIFAQQGQGPTMTPQNDGSNKYGDATVVQVGDYNSSFVDQTKATGGGWYYDAGSGTDATVNVNGDYNQTFIRQVGNKNVAGSDIQNIAGDACSGFTAENVGETFGRSASVWMTDLPDLELACCRVIPFVNFKLDLPGVMPGIYVTGDNNVASIAQHGDYSLAGIEITGDYNRAGIRQEGNYNVAGISIDGTENKVIIKQFSDALYGGLNNAIAHVDGDGNQVGARQETSHNDLGQSVVGNDNVVFAKQYGRNWNVAIQKVEGNDNNVLLFQDGSANRSYQETTGSMHNSWVYQEGMRNRSVVVQ